MKRLHLVAVAALLLVSFQAFAQCNPDYDEICIVFDPDSCCENCTQVSPGTLVDVYFVLHNPSAGSILGYEFDVCEISGPGVVFLGMEVPGLIAPDPMPPVQIGLPTPLASAPCVLLAVMHLLPISLDCWCTGVRPHPYPTIVGQMVYVDGDDPGNLIPMKPCTGPEWDACVMACINCGWCPPDPPVQAEAATWGMLKTLYH